MLFIEPCLPTFSRLVPTGAQWAYEIKHDGFRFLAVRHSKRVRVYSRAGHDWSKQLPAIADAMQALPVRSAVLDGEGVICSPEGKSDFNAMRACFSRNGAPEAFLYAFGLLELDGRDLRTRPWAARPAALVSLLDGADAGIRLCEHIEDTDGAVVFRPRATWTWRESSPSAVTVATGRDGRVIGSRSKIPHIRRSNARC
jgi:bifunctional non-homologous end joining protein LigD